MDKVNVEEGNKLIAEFMGLRIDTFPDKSDWWYVDLENPDSMYHNKNESLFHSSWDWLMPVYGKFLDLRKTGDSFFEDETALGLWNLLEDAILLCNIVAAHNYLSKLIKWYNNNQK